MWNRVFFLADESLGNSETVGNVVKVGIWGGGGGGSYIRCFTAVLGEFS